MENIWQMVLLPGLLFYYYDKALVSRKKIHNYAIVDVGWAFSLVAITFVYYFFSGKVL